MTKPVIPTLPPYPTRGEDRETFATKANAHVAALPEWASKVDEMGIYVDGRATDADGSATEAANSATSAQTANETAAGSANFKGQWSTLTGALNIPASVAHNDRLWVLLANVADVTLSEPGVSADWLFLSPPTQLIRYDEYLTSSFWVKPNGANFVYVEAIGGGAGGSNDSNSLSTAWGGGGGGFTSMFMSASDVGVSEVTITIGAGGDGALASSDGTGSDGGDSSFGSLVIARGGKSTDDADQEDPAKTPNGGGGEAPSHPRPANERAGGGGYSSGSGGFGLGAGGSCVMGGAGGGGRSTGTVGAGGLSAQGGNGGAGDGSNGVVPGGGGGAANGAIAGGNGAGGRIRVWVW